MKEMRNLYVNLMRIPEENETTLEGTDGRITLT
jgi:hypothetical protein